MSMNTACSRQPHARTRALILLVSVSALLDAAPHVGYEPPLPLVLAGNACPPLLNLRLSGGAPGVLPHQRDLGANRPPSLSKLDLAAAGGAPDVIVPRVLAGHEGDGDDSTSGGETRPEEDRDEPALSSCPESPETAGKVRQWGQQEIQSLYDKYVGNLMDPHAPLMQMTEDGSIRKHLLQPGASAAPKPGETVFFHYELYYEDIMVACSRHVDGRYQPALSCRVGGPAVATQQEERDGSVGGGSGERQIWEIIFQNTSRGECSMVLVTGQRRQQELLQPPFMVAASGASARLVLGRKPLRLVLDVFAFGHQPLNPPAQMPAAWFGGAQVDAAWGGKLRNLSWAMGEAEWDGDSSRASSLQDGASQESQGGGAALAAGAGGIVYECTKWGSGGETPSFGDEVLLRVKLVEDDGHGMLCEERDGDTARQRHGWGSQGAHYARLGDSDLPIGVEYAVAAKFRHGAAARLTVSGKWLVTSRQVRQAHARHSAGGTVAQDVPASLEGAAVRGGRDVLAAALAATVGNGDEAEARGCRGPLGDRREGEGLVGDASAQEWVAGGTPGRARALVFDVEVLEWNDILDCVALCGACCTWPRPSPFEAEHSSDACSTALPSRQQQLLESARRGTAQEAGGAGALGRELAWEESAALCGPRAGGEGKLCQNATCMSQGRVLARRRMRESCVRRWVTEADEVLLRCAPSLLLARSHLETSATSALRSAVMRKEFYMPHKRDVQR